MTTSSTSEQTVVQQKVAQLFDVPPSTTFRTVKTGDLTGCKITPSRRNSHLHIYCNSVDELLRRRHRQPNKKQAASLLPD